MLHRLEIVLPHLDWLSRSLWKRFAWLYIVANTGIWWPTQHDIEYHTVWAPVRYSGMIILVSCLPRTILTR